MSFWFQEELNEVVTFSDALRVPTTEMTSTSEGKGETTPVRKDEAF